MVEIKSEIRKVRDQDKKTPTIKNDHLQNNERFFVFIISSKVAFRPKFVTH